MEGFHSGEGVVFVDVVVLHRSRDGQHFGYLGGALLRLRVVQRSESLRGRGG